MASPPRRTGPGALLAELQRRRVLHVAAVYAVVAWVVIQVASVVFPALHLPSWTVTFVVALAALGWPIALVLAWAFELTPEGVRRTELAGPLPAPGGGGTAGAAGRVGSAAGPSSGLRGRRALLPVALLVVLAAGAGWWLTRRSPGAPAAAVSPTALAVLPFSVRGSGELAYLAEGMVNLLATKLDGAGDLRSVDPRAVLGIAAQEEGGVADPARGGAIAERLGAGLYVVGDLVEIERRLHIQASVYEPASGQAPIARASVEGEAHDLFRMVDELAARLLVELNRGPGGRITRLAAVTTDSLSALKAYLEGDRHLRAGDQDSAVAAFDRAVRIDTAFALGYYRLGVAWMARGDLSGQRIFAALDQAAERADRLASHDRLLLEAASAWGHSDVGFTEHEGGLSGVEAMYRRILAAYPEDVEAWFWLAELLFHNNPLRGRSISDSRAAWERVLAFEPHNRFAVMHLARIAASSNDTATLTALAAPFTGRSVTGDRRVVEVAALRALALGDTAEEARVAEQLHTLPDESLSATLRYLVMSTRNPAGAARLARVQVEPSRPPAQRVEGNLLLAYLHLAQGRRSEAVVRFDSARAIDPEFGRSIQALASLLPFASAPAQERRALLRALGDDSASAPVSAWSPAENYPAIAPAFRAYLRGRLALSLGDVAAARRELETLERTPGAGPLVGEAGGLAHALRAHLADHAGRPREAVAHLDSIRQRVLFGAGLLPGLFHQERLLRARLLTQLGRDREALELYAALSESSPLDVVILAPSHLARAEIYGKQGDRERAVAHYRRFLELWRDADPEMQPRVREAARQLELLATRP